jgi:arylsulfatase A-like enzyme
VLTSDHGEEFWEHGSARHGGTVYQELLHVPLLIRLPGGKLHKRVRSRVPIQALLPTLLEFAGIDPSPQPGWAPSLTPLLRKNAIDRYEAPIISGATHIGEYQWSVVMGRMKYIERRPSGREELYDLDADPEERISILRQHPKVAAAARKILEEHREFAAATLQDAASVGGEDDEEWKSRLRALGYIE